MSSLVNTSLRLPASLEDAKVKAVPDAVYYIADFITKDEEEELLSKITSAPKPRWKMLSHRRLQTWPADLIKNTLFEAALPPWLENPIVPRLSSIPLFKDKDSHIFSSSPHQTPNHVLVNEYLSGQGIMPHKDGAAYHPVVCTVSLGGTICLDIYSQNEDGRTETKPRWKILQEPRSLLITTGKIYADYLHGIAETTQDLNLNFSTVANWPLLRSPDCFRNGTSERQTRTSLTYRDVLKVSKLGSKLGFMCNRS